MRFKMKYLLLILLSITLSTTGCILEDSSPEATDGPGTLTQTAPIDTSNWSDVTPEQTANADSLVALATISGIASIDDMFDNPDNWDEFKNRAPNQALKLYDEALAVAPGHRQALFGKTITSMLVLSQNTKINKFIDDMEVTIDKYDDESEPIQPIVEDITLKTNSSNSYKSAAHIMNLNPEKAPNLLLKTSAQLSNTDDVTVQDLQDVIMSAVLPELNEAISRLEIVLATEDFEFEFTIRPGTNDEKLVQIDAGEVGPLLAGLRIFRSYLIVIVAHDLDVTLDGSYDWVNELDEMDDDDLDDLSPKQEAALDHVTGMFKKDASVTTLNPAYAADYANIPAQLLQAVNDVETALEYGLKEAQSGENTQENDPYSVGTGEEHDINPGDLETAIEQMAHFKKYFTGDVAFTYNKGTESFRINIPNYFKRSGNLQQYLPYFKFRPYSEWNDIIGSDTSWTKISLKEYADRYGEESCRIEKEGNDYTLYCAEDGYDSDYNTYEYCEEKPESSEYDYYCYYSDWSIDEKQQVPFYFTNAAGDFTMDPNEDIDSPSDLKGKVIFPDPTFGGVFPDFTNDNIFDYVESLEDIEPYDATTCEETRDENGYWDEECTVNPLPTNPSDLDRLIFVIANFLD